MSAKRQARKRRCDGRWRALRQPGRAAMGETMAAASAEARSAAEMKSVFHITTEQEAAKVDASAQLRACVLEKTGLLVYALIHEALTNRAISRESGFNSAVKRRSCGPATRREIPGAIPNRAASRESGHNRFRISLSAHRSLPTQGEAGGPPREMEPRLTRQPAREPPRPLPRTRLQAGNFAGRRRGA